MKKIFSLFAAVLFVGSMFAADAVSTLEFKAACGGTGTADDGAVWAVTSDAEESTYDGTKGIHYGTSKKNVQYIQLTTADIEGTIKQVVVNASGAKNVTANLTVKVGDVDFKVGEATSAAIATDAANYTFTGSASGAIVVRVDKGSASKGALYVKSIVVTYESGAAPAVAKPVISGKEKFVGETEVTISCETEGAKVYYTLDGSEPTATSTEGKSVKLTASATVKAIAILGEDKSAIASKTFTCYEAKTCAEATALAANEITGLNEVLVTYVNGGNIYVKDATGYELIYAFDFGLAAGDVVNGFIGKSSPYNGLPELKPDGIITSEDLDITHGEAPAPEEITAAPTAADINKYLIIKGVSVVGTFTTSVSNLDATIGEETFVLRNNFKIAQTFEAGKKYDIVGAGAIYNTTLQLYFISASESTATALDNTDANVKVEKFFENGQLVIIKNGVKYNATGAIVK